MELNKNKKIIPGFNTLSIHHGKSFAEETGCIMPPIFATSTFKHGNVENFTIQDQGIQILES